MTRRIAGDFTVGIVAKAMSWTEYANYVALSAAMFDAFLDVDSSAPATIEEQAQAQATLQQARAWICEAKRVTNGNLRTAYAKALANRARDYASRAQRTMEGIVNARRRPQGMNQRDCAQLQGDIKQLERGFEALHAAAVREFVLAGGDAALIRSAADIKDDLRVELRGATAS